MLHKVRVTVLERMLNADLQRKYCADPESGKCPCCHEGDEFIFERCGDRDDFWHCGAGTLVRTDVKSGQSERMAGGFGGVTHAGSKGVPFCSEAWDAVSRYIYTALQGVSIMHGWMRDERVMIACCNDGTRPVIFRIERLDCRALYIEGIRCDGCRERVKKALMAVPGVTDVKFRPEFTEAYLDREVPDEALRQAAEGAGGYKVARID